MFDDPHCHSKLSINIKKLATINQLALLLETRDDSKIFRFCHANLAFIIDIRLG